MRAATLPDCRHEPACMSAGEHRVVAEIDRDIERSRRLLERLARVYDAPEPPITESEWRLLDGNR